MLFLRWCALCGLALLAWGAWRLGSVLMEGSMSIPLLVICLVSALLATGAGALCAALDLPGWLGRIVELAVLLICFAWLQVVV